MSGPNAGEVPRLQQESTLPELQGAPQLRGEHGQLQSWITAVLERLRLETKEDLRAVREQIGKLADRVSAIEGGEEERSRWRERAENKIDALLARPSVAAAPVAEKPAEPKPEPEAKPAPRPWWAELLTERTISLLVVAAMAIIVLWFAAAARFGLDNVDRSIDHHIGRDVPAK